MKRLNCKELAVKKRMTKKKMKTTMTINNFKRLSRHKQKKVEQNDYIEVVDNQELLSGDDEGEDFDDFSSKIECTEIDRTFLDTISEDSDFYEISVKPSNEWLLSPNDNA